MLDLVLVGMGMVFLGLLVLLLATVASGKPEEAERRTEVKGGGVILIGPIPIVFGSDAKWAGIAILLAIVLSVIVLISWVLSGL